MVFVWKSLLNSRKTSAGSIRQVLRTNCVGVRKVSIGSSSKNCSSDIAKAHFSYLSEKSRLGSATARRQNQYVNQGKILLTRFQDRFFGIDQTRGFQTEVVQCKRGKETGNSHQGESETLSSRKYEELASETLDNLSSYFDEILERSSFEDGDVLFGNGVLTVKLGRDGTYVINKQSPNKQIWLSSPKSGPKRYDYLNSDWIYKHTGESMFDLLNQEIREILKDVPDLDFHSAKDDAF